MALHMHSRNIEALQSRVLTLVESSSIYSWILYLGHVVGMKLMVAMTHDDVKLRLKQQTGINFS